MTSPALDTRLDERNGFLDAVMGAIRYLDLIDEASLARATDAPAPRDETTGLICDALLGLASLRVTFAGLTGEDSLPVEQGPEELRPSACWDREHLR